MNKVKIAKTCFRCHVLALSSLLFLFLSTFSSISQAAVAEDDILSYIVDPQLKQLRLYWKSANGENFADFQRLRSALSRQQETLIFATNGGMYSRQQRPKGLYIEKGKTLSKLDSATKGFGNFYLQPNGIFYLTHDREAKVVKSADFEDKGQIRYATQSGPMLVVDGKINSLLNKGSSNLQIRNGVGIMPGGKILFALSKQAINFYDFASYFKRHHCANALYLDGFVSRAYLPEKHWQQLDGNFAVIIGVSEKKNK